MQEHGNRSLGGLSTPCIGWDEKSIDLELDPSAVHNFTTTHMLGSPAGSRNVFFIDLS
jgi:hypothetical protein